MLDDSNLLIVSDFHLSEGRDTATGKVSRNEDFFFDDDFADFLTYHQRIPGEWKLIINGDFIDFLQVTSQPAHGKTGLLTDPVYGLKTGPEESAWKLRRVSRGHVQLFEALSHFALEHQISVISGNHDIEFFYLEVQEAFLEELEACVPEDRRDRIRANVEFLPWFYYEEDLYVEHGHQYDSLNAFTYVLDPRLPRTDRVKSCEQNHIDLPLGSLFVRYLFNRVEVSSPFADNIKPPTRFIGWFVTHHPLLAMRFLFREGREMFRRIKEKWEWTPASAFADRKLSHETRLVDLAAEMANRAGGFSKEQWTERLTALNKLREPSFMRGPAAAKWKLVRFLMGPYRTPVLFLLVFLVPFFEFLIVFGTLFQQAIPTLILPYVRTFQKAIDPWWISFSEAIRLLFLLELLLAALWIRSFRRMKRISPELLKLRNRAEQIHHLLSVKYVVMGHTHEADLHDSEPDRHYFNTGTWTKVFGEEVRVLREEKEFTFVRVMGKGPKRRARLMKWEGASKTARLAYLFAHDR